MFFSPLLCAVLPHIEQLPSATQAAADWNSPAKQPGGTFPSPQLPHAGEIQVLCVLICELVINLEQSFEYHTIYYTLLLQYFCDTARMIIRTVFRKLLQDSKAVLHFG